jgi:hypothetical protein
MSRAQLWPPLADYVFLRIAEAIPAMDWRSRRGREPVAGMSPAGPDSAGFFLEAISLQEQAPEDWLSNIVHASPM